MRFGQCAVLGILFIALGLSGGNSFASRAAPVQDTFVPLPVLPISRTFAQPSNSQSVQVASMSAPTRDGRLPVLIITDPKDYGDDSIAIHMLLRSSRVDIRGIITTAGNVCASRGAEEATRLVTSAGAASIPIVQGFPFSWHDERRRFYEKVERPAWQRPSYVGAFADPGLCDGKGKNASNTNAADFLIQQVNADGGELTIILIGPATVLAEALRRNPHLGDHIRRIYAMGGAVAVAGNVTQYAEFNVWFDPEAMAAILTSKVPVTLVPLDATADVFYYGVPPQDEPPRDFAAKHLRTYLARAAAKGTSVRMWDEVVAAIVIDPTIAETERDIYLSVSTTKNEQYGQMISTSVAAYAGARPVEVITKVRSDRVCQLVTQLLLNGD